MLPRQAKPGSPARRVVWRSAMLAVLLGLALGLSSCLEEASDKDYDYDNPNDTTPSDSSSDDEGGMAVFSVNDIANIVVIINQAASEQDMDGWMVTNEDESETYEFIGFALGAGDAVRLHSADGTDDDNDLYTGQEDVPNWGSGDLNDIVILQDSSGSSVASCSRGDSCWPL